LLMTEPNPEISKNEAAAFACARRMNPALGKILDQRGAVEPFICALTKTFAELLKERGGNSQSFILTLATFSDLPAALHKQVPKYHAHIKVVIGQLKHDGFSLDAILSSMLGAILGLYQACRVPQNQIDDAGDSMIMALNEAQGH
jgi:hypothetical protein